MSLSEIVIKLVGLAFIIVGFGLILAAIGINLFGVSLPIWWIDAIVGVLFLAAGIYLVRGGTIGL